MNIIVDRLIFILRSSCLRTIIIFIFCLFLDQFFIICNALMKGFGRILRVVYDVILQRIEPGRGNHQLYRNILFEFLLWNEALSNLLSGEFWLSPPSELSKTMCLSFCSLALFLGNNFFNLSSSWRILWFSCFDCSSSSLIFLSSCRTNSLLNGVFYSLVKLANNAFLHIFFGASLNSSEFWNILMNDVARWSGVYLQKVVFWILRVGSLGLLQ